MNNFDPVKGAFLPGVGDFLGNDEARANFLRQVDAFLAANPNYRGLSLDFEEIPTNAQPGYLALITALYNDLHPRNLRLYVNTPTHYSTAKVRSALATHLVQRLISSMPCTVASGSIKPVSRNPTLTGSGHATFSKG